MQPAHYDSLTLSLIPNPSDKYLPELIRPDFLTESAGMFRQNLTLHFNPEPTGAPSLQLDVGRANKGLHLNLAGAASSVVDIIDVDIPLERQR